jgi:uncharacterized lipoprotein YddW (UPF0748 family)
VLLILLFLVALPWISAPVDGRVPDGSQQQADFAPDHEVRALWVVRTTLSSPDAISTMVEAARAGGFNTLLVQVRGRGDALYLGGSEPRSPVLAAHASFDPLADVILKSHAVGLRVHAWVNVNLVASAADLPAARGHLIYRHPEWMMLPEALAGDLARLDPRSPEYLGRLARYIRGHPNQLEGIYVSPLVEEAADHVASVVRDIATRYDVDGVHLDYVRFPSADFDYSPAALAAFRKSILPHLAASDRLRYDASAEQNPLVYTRIFPERWLTFRQTQLTRLIVKLRDAVKRARPNALLSAAVVPDSGEAATQRLQDWQGWIARGLLDIVCPMAYTTDSARFAKQVAAAKAVAGAQPVWAGIGAYQLSQPEIVANIRTARRLGVDGIILFSYDRLTGPQRGLEYLSAVAHAAFSE